MQRVFWVKNGELSEVNEWLQKGGVVKSIHAVSETVSAYGYAGGETFLDDKGYYWGDVYAYVVVGFD